MQIWSRTEASTLPRTRRLELPTRVLSLSGSLVFWCVVAALWGGVLAWRYRNFMGPDGISYLDMASQASQNGPLALVNRYWSPLYPALLMLWERIHEPSPFREFAYAHALNAAIYAVAAISFGYFLRGLMQCRMAIGRSTAKKAVFVAFGFGVFFRFMNTDFTAFVITPDLLVAIVAFLAAGLFFRILQGQIGWRTFAALGVVLGIGYLAKAAMLPAGIILLFILLVQSPRSKPRRKGVWIAAIVLCLISAPQILLVSQRVHHFSISETGRLNYLWAIDHIQAFQGWTGGPDGEMPKHGPRILATNPKLIEFASPIPGTYPLWYDPAYWYAGAKPQFNWRGEIHAIKNSLQFYRDIFDLGDLRLPFEGLVVLSILAYVEHRAPARANLVVWLWPTAVLFMYALVYSEYRLVAPFLVIFWMAIYSAMLIRMGRTQAILLAILAGVMLLSSVRETFSSSRRSLEANQSDSGLATYWLSPSRRVFPDEIAAQRLISLNIKAGDPIATVGPAFMAFYARIAGVRVIAEAVNPAQFWRLSPKEAVSAEQTLAGTGAEILVGVSRPKTFQPRLWEDISGTPYSFLRLGGSEKLEQ